MDTDRLRGVAAWLDATPAETAGLALLLSGAALAAGLLWWAAIPRPVDAPSAPVAAPSPALSVLTVHVAGAVAHPGVVRVAPGARVADAVDAAGGPLPDAVLDGLNLARPLEDGERVLVPTVFEPAPAADGPDGATGADGRVDLNRASAAELEELPGIGPVLAERIVSWREEHGPFREVGDLREVPGIGERTFQSLVDHIAV